MPLNNEQQIGVLEKVILLIEKYGIWKILKAIFIIALFLYIIYNIQNLNNIIEKAIESSIDNAVRKEFVSYNEEQKAEHDVMMENRRDANSKMPEILSEIMAKTNADRVFVMELHNGSSNLNSLPFIYGNLTYEKCKKGILSIGDDYQNFLLSRFNFPIYLETKQIWAGSIEELNEIDENFAKRLSSNNVSYFAIVKLQGLSVALGYMGVSYCNNTTPLDKDDLSINLLVEAQSIASLLDMTNE